MDEEAEELKRVLKNIKPFPIPRSMMGHSLKGIVFDVKQIANNALYFGDKSEYKTALCKILTALGVEDLDNLEYIEDDEREEIK